MTRAVALLVVCACGSHKPAAPDAGACTAAFAGAFVDAVDASTACPTVAQNGDVELSFAIDSSEIGAQVMIAIDLGPAPTTGETTSETIVDWHAVEARSVGIAGGCVYSAGSDVTPNGSFALELSALDVAAGTAHGTLDVTQYVHALEATDCGPSDTETIHSVF